MILKRRPAVKNDQELQRSCFAVIVPYVIYYVIYYECFKNRQDHYLDYLYPTYGTYNENFKKFY